MSDLEEAPDLEFRLLGTPRIFRGGEELIRFRTLRVQALLIYLAASGAVCSRATLTAFFWPEAREERARASLRNTLYHLRKLVGDSLIITRHTVALEKGAIASDIAQFDALLKTASDAEADIMQLQAAISLYRGDFLEGFHVLDAPQFEQWSAHERERLREGMLNALLAVAGWHVAQADHTGALEHYNRLLGLDPANEAGHRHKMALLARHGRRSEALSQFQSCERALREELDVSPAPETVALYELILAGTYEVAHDAPTAVRAGRQHSATDATPEKRVQSPAGDSTIQVDFDEMPRQRAFFGRRGDLALLTRWLTAERCSLIAVAGMGGVGKTALVTELASRLARSSSRSRHARGVSVGETAPVPPGVSGGQDQADEGAAWDLVVWRSLVNAPSLTEIVTSWLLTLHPQGQEALPDNLYRRLDLLFRELARRRCLLILDNMDSILAPGGRIGHYRPGYEDYAQLLDRMAAGHHQSCLLLTTREVPKGVRGLEEDDPKVRILSLGGLSINPARELLQDRGLEVSGASLETLVDRYSGNPLALKLAADTARDLFAGDVRSFLGGGAPVFDDIRDVLDAQFGRLSDLGREVLVWLAIEREPVTVQALWENLVHSPRQREYLETIRSLRRSSLIEEVGDDSNTQVLRLALQNVVMEYATDLLVTTFLTELSGGQLDWWHRHALVKAQSREFVQEAQRRLLLRPIAEWLVNRSGRIESVQRLTDLLRKLREEAIPAGGYAAANILNLLLYLGVDLRGYDFSGLPVWQADLRRARLVDVDFRKTDLKGSTFRENFGAILGVAVSPNGRHLAAGSTDGVVYVWQLVDRQPTHALRGHELSAAAPVFSCDGRTLATGGADEAIRLWDVETGTLIRSLRHPEAPITVSSLSFHGDMLAAAGTINVVYLWNWRTGEALGKLSAPGVVDAIDFSPDGVLLAGVGGGSGLIVWDIHSGAIVHSQGAAESGHTVAFSPGGEWLAAGGENGHISVWMVDGMRQRHVLTGHSNWILSLAFSPDGRRLVSGSADSTARLWDMDRGDQWRALTGHGGWVRSVAFTPDGQSVVTGGDDQTVRLWDAQDGELRHYLQGHLRWVDFVRFSPDGRHLISTSFGGAVRLWDVDSGQLLREMEDRQAAARAVAFSQDGSLLACGRDDHTACVWEVDTGARLLTLHGHRGPVRDIAFSPDHRYLITGSHDHTLRIWDVTNGQMLRVIPNTNARLQFAMALQPRGELLAFGALDHTVKLLRLNSRQLVGSLPLGDTVPEVVAFSPQGDRVACGAEDGSIWVWDLAKAGVADAGIMAPAQQTKLYPPGIWRLLFSPDGQMLACVDRARTAHVLDASTGRLRYSVPSWYGAFCLGFSRDGAVLFTAGPDNTILLRDAGSGEVRRSLRGHTAGLTSLDVSPDDTLIASSSADGTVRMWDVETGACRAILEPARPYAGMNIVEARGITATQKATLAALGAIVDR